MKRNYNSKPNTQFQISQEFNMARNPQNPRDSRFRTTHFPEISDYFEVSDQTTIQYKFSKELTRFHTKNLSDTYRNYINDPKFPRFSSLRTDNRRA